MKRTYEYIINPILVRVGLMWSTDTIPSVQEHFISNILRQKILSSIDALPLAKSGANKWLLFLPEDEFHEIGLLYAAFVIRQAGNQIVYLGSSVPLQSAVMAANDTDSNRLMLFLVRHKLTNEIQDYLAHLGSENTGKHIYVAGNHKLLNQVNIPQSVTWLKDIESLEKIVSIN